MLEAFESPRIVRMRRRDGSVERVDIDELAGYLQREARAMRRELVLRWSRGALRRLAALRLDAGEGYLAAAVDLADLEQRLKALDRYERSRITRPR